MSIQVSSIKHSHGPTVLYKQPRYVVEANLKETILGQEKDYKESLLLPDVLNVKIARIFKEVEEYIESSRDGGILQIGLESCDDEKTVGYHIYYSDEKVITARVARELFNNRKEQLAYSVVDQIGQWFGWRNEYKQKLILHIKGQKYEEVISILRAYSNIEVCEVDSPKKG